VDEPRPVSAPIRRVAAAMEPQATSGPPFHMAMGPERVWGTFNLTHQGDANEMIRRLTALKEFLNPGKKEATN